MQANQKVGEDARNIERHQQDNAVMPPFARQKALHLPSRLPYPGVLPVDGQDVSTHEVFAMAESGDQSGIAGEEGEVHVRLAGLGLGVFHGW